MNSSSKSLSRRRFFKFAGCTSALAVGTKIASFPASLSTQANSSDKVIAAVPPVELQVELDDAASEFFVVEVKGTSYERGLQHGKALRKVIRPTVARFKYDLISPMLEALDSNADYADYQAFFLENTGLLKIAEQQVPDLVEEIRGIAEGLYHVVNHVHNLFLLLPPQKILRQHHLVLLETLREEPLL